MKFFNNSWDGALEEEFGKPYFQALLQKVDEEYEKYHVYPPREKIFSALKLCPFDQVKVVLLGQDPYHEKGQAHGLCFSVLPGIKVPPSLKNIYKEMSDDVGTTEPDHGYLISWAKQGVLMLNTTLTVREGQPNSHSQYGWQTFTDEVIRKVNDLDTPVVFILWGANAKAKMPLITNKKHLVLTAAHPSPFSAYNGFFGCRHFSKTNEFLKKNGREPINWQV